MNPKPILCAALILSCLCTAFALAYSIQLKPDAPHGGILIWSKSNDGICSFNVVLLPETNSPSQGWLELNNGTNRVAACPLEVALLSENPNGWGSMEKCEYYRAMTNRFSRPLNGARVFKFEVATNLLERSTFSIGESSGGSSFSQWFYLRDFADRN